MGEITVSVITPTYNMADLLPDTIRAIQSQTLRGIQHIVIDDGSTDNTPEVAASFGDAITYKRLEKVGISRARNEGLQIIRGSAVMFLDADDLIAPDALEHLFRALNGRDNCIVYGTTHDYYCRSGRWIASDAAHPPNPPLNDPIHGLLMRQWTFYPCAQLWPRTLVDQNGTFDERCTALQDFDFLLRALSEGTTIMHVPAAVSYYRRHEDQRFSMSQSHHRRDVFEARIYMIEKLENRFRDLNLYDKYRIPIARFYFGLAVAHFGHHPELSEECADRAWRIARWESMPLAWPRRVLCRTTGFSRYRRLARRFGSG